MPWLSITLVLDGARADAFADALSEAGALSVDLQDAEAGTPREAAQFDSPAARTPDDPPRVWPRTRITALLEAQASPDAVLHAACAIAGEASPPDFTHQRIDDEDWVRRSQSQFAPLRAGERLWIVPSWHQAPADPRAIVVHLDPGLAFGTGSHPSTRMVLGWLERRLSAGPAPRSLLDYGCGSGILAIAGAALGIAEVHATDIDPAALEACAQNAQRNAVRVGTFSAGDLPRQPYDLVVANILANPLVLLAPVLAAHARPGAGLALSGVLEAQAAMVQAAYRDSFDTRIAVRDEGWILIEGERR